MDEIKVGEKIRRVKSRSQENCPQSEFWSKARDIRKIEDQLIKVLRLVDGDEKPRWVSFMRHCIVSFMRHLTGKSCRFKEIAAIIRRTRRLLTIYGIFNCIMISRQLVCYMYIVQSFIDFVSYF